MLRRELLSVCQNYAESHGNIFNYSKTVCMTFKAECKKHSHWQMGAANLMVWRWSWYYVSTAAKLLVWCLRLSAKTTVT